MQNLTFPPSACTDKQNLPKFFAHGLGVFESGEFFGRRSFMDFIKRLVRGLMPKFKQPRSRTA